MPIPAERIDEQNVEQDDRFPSGEWEGFYLQPDLPGRHGMELLLTFREGTLRGEGRDMIGDFLITGTYERDSGKCSWSKRYLGKHDVAYQGYNEGKGIWGVWEINATYKGGFHIWPVGKGNGYQKAVSEEVEMTSFAGAGVGFGDLEAESESDSPTSAD